jgi:hypothetical protein
MSKPESEYPPQTICEHCWDGPDGDPYWFSKAVTSLEVHYSRHFGELEASARSGCLWCNFVFSIFPVGLVYNHEDWVSVSVVSIDSPYYVGVNSAQRLRISIQADEIGNRHLVYDIYTNRGIACLCWILHENSS